MGTFGWVRGRILSFFDLGLPLEGNARAISFWDTPIEKIRKRLASWKKRFFSKAGRLMLIRLMLSETPIYYLSLFCALEKLMRDFLPRRGGGREKVSFWSFGKVVGKSVKQGV